MLRARHMRPDPKARPEYIAAFREIVNRIGDSLAGLPKRTLPIRMYVAGGAALHMYTGERVSRDIDATFSHRIALPENLEVAYRSKLGRFSSQDRDDIAALARHKLIHSSKLRQRAEEALVGYVGDTTRVQGSIDLAVRIVADIESRGGKGHALK
jgi:hypothetical protein